MEDFGQGFALLLKTLVGMNKPQTVKASQKGSVKGASTRIPSPTPQNQYPYGASKADIEQVIREGAGAYTDLPVATLSGTMTNEMDKYPIFKKYPFLPVGQSILESSGLKAFQTKPDLVNKPKQALGWGVYVDNYNPPTVQDVFKDYISAIGGRRMDQETQNYPEDVAKARVNTSNTYQGFRDTGDINALANIYAPKSDNPEHGGDVYANNLKNVMGTYDQKLKKLMMTKYGPKK